MVWFLFRRPIHTQRVKRSETLFRSVDDLFDLLMDGLTRYPPPEYEVKWRGFCRQCGAPYSESPRTHGLCGKCSNERVNREAGPSTLPCAGCGMRFSANLMRDGLCNNCRSGNRIDGQNSRHDSSRPSRPVSEVALRRAYQVLGCDENDSDESIRKRHRELAKELHADSLSHEASPERITEANDQFCRMQEAYEIIVVARKKRS